MHLVAAQVRYTLDDILRPFGLYAREQLSLASHIADRLGIAIPAADISQESVPTPTTMDEQVPAPMPDPMPDPVPDPVPESIPEPVSEPPPMSTGDAVDLTMDELDNFGLDDLFEKQTSGLVESALASFLAQENEAAEAAAAAAATAAATPSHNGENDLEQLQAVADANAAKVDGAPASQTNGSLMTDYKELEALVAESTSNYVRTTLQGLSPTPYQPVVPVSTGEFVYDCDTLT